LQAFIMVDAPVRAPRPIEYFGIHMTVSRRQSTQGLQKSGMSRENAIQSQALCHMAREFINRLSYPKRGGQLQ